VASERFRFECQIMNITKKKDTYYAQFSPQIDRDMQFFNTNSATSVTSCTVQYLEFISNFFVHTLVFLFY
jgi:hypothetical protein